MVDRETSSLSSMERAIKREQSPPRPSWLNPLSIAGPLSAWQWFYWLGIQGVGAAVISGAANFGVACAMYRTTSRRITVWDINNNTVAGDLAVTTFIQGTLTYLISSALISLDMRNNLVAPFPYPWPDPCFARVPIRQSDKRPRWWKLFVGRHGLGRGLHMFSGSERQDLFDFKLRPFSKLARRWVWGIWTGLVLSAIYFLVLWPISIAIIAPIWNGKNMNNGSWTAPIIKLVYGFVYGLLMTPLVAAFTLGSESAVREHSRASQRERLAAFIASREPVALNSRAERAHWHHSGQGPDIADPHLPRNGEASKGKEEGRLRREATDATWHSGKSAGLVTVKKLRSVLAGGAGLMKTKTGAGKQPKEEGIVMEEKTKLETRDGEREKQGEPDSATSGQTTSSSGKAETEIAS